MSELSKENLLKEELINEANKALEELADDKHDIKAKFKHLLQVYVHNISQSINQSSYKGDDSSLSLGNCFEQLQEVLENGQGERDERPIAQMLQESREIDSHQSRLSGIQKQLEIANSMMSQNDEEIRRQATVIETA